MNFLQPPSPLPRPSMGWMITADRSPLLAAEAWQMVQQLGRTGRNGEPAFNVTLDIPMRGEIAKKLFLITHFLLADQHL